MFQQNLHVERILFNLNDLFDQEITDFAYINRQGIMFAYYNAIAKGLFEWQSMVKVLKDQEAPFYSRTVNASVYTIFHVEDDIYLCIYHATKLPLKRLKGIYHALFDVSFYLKQLKRFNTNIDDNTLVFHLNDSFEIIHMNPSAYYMFPKSKSLETLNLNATDWACLKKHLLGDESHKADFVHLNGEAYSIYVQTYLDKQGIILILSKRIFVQAYLDQTLKHLDLGIAHYKIERNQHNEAVDARFLYLNKRYAEMIEKSYDQIINHTVKDIFPSIPLARLARFFKVAEIGEPMVQDYRFHAIDKYFHVYTYAPNKEEFINIYYETTQFHALKDTHQAELIKLKMMLDQAQMGFIEINYENKTLFADNFVHELFEEQNIDYDCYRDIINNRVHRGDYEEIMKHNKAFLLGNYQKGETLFRVRTKKGHFIYVKYYIKALETNAFDQPTKIYILVIDKTKEEKQNRIIKYHASHDTETKLFNRRSLTSYTNDMRNINEKALVLFDLDGLKVVNDVLGHQKGDELIKQFVEYVKEIFKNEFIARVGGDEFVLLSKDSFEDLRIKLNILYRKIIKTKVDFLPVSVSLGFTKIDRRKAFTTLFNEAEKMMYHNKLMQRKEKQHETLRILRNLLLSKDPRYAHKVKRLKRLGIPLLKLLNYGRKSEIQSFAQMIEYHGIGRVSSLVEDAFEDKKYTLHETPNQFAEIGYKIIISLMQDYDVADGILHQNEWFDGSGEPHQFKGKDIPLFSRILHTINIYDSLTESKDYGKHYTSSEALSILFEQNGSRFDPAVLTAFTKVIKSLENNA